MDECYHPPRRTQPTLFHLVRFRAKLGQVRSNSFEFGHSRQSQPGLEIPPDSDTFRPELTRFRPCRGDLALRWRLAYDVETLRSVAGGRLGRGSRRWVDPWVRAAGANWRTRIRDSPAEVTACSTQATMRRVEREQVWGLEAGPGGQTDFSQRVFGAAGVGSTGNAPIFTERLTLP